MITFPKREELISTYNKYADEYFRRIRIKYGKVSNEIELKKEHGLSMARNVEATTIDTGLFNATYGNSAYIEGLLHDIGRFPQYLNFGTLNDVVLDKHSGLKNHGFYGRVILSQSNSSLLRAFLPVPSAYDFVVTEIVGEHTTVFNPNYLCEIADLQKVFQDTSFERVVESSDQELKNKLIALKLKILQEVDSLELLMNVGEGKLNLRYVMELDNFADEGEIWQDFMNFRYMDLNSYKERGVWKKESAHSFFFRYGLLTRVVNFVAILREFRDNGYFDKIWERTQYCCFDKEGNQVPVMDPLMYEAQEYIQLAVNNLIETSPDGIIITPESREKARKLTIEMWEKRKAVTPTKTQIYYFVLRKPVGS